LKSRRGFGTGSSVVSVGDTSEETVGTGVGVGAYNGIDGGRGINSNALTALCEEKYGIDSKNVTYADTKYFLLVGL